MVNIASISFMQKVKGVKDIEIENNRVLIRVDFNVPMTKNSNISDDTRIREALPTINYCIDHGAKSIVLVSHLGRPKERSDRFSLKHLVKRIERLLARNIIFADTIDSAIRSQNTNTDSNKQYVINKIYIMLNELQNAVNMQDESIFLIKYKNILEEMNNL